MWAENADENMQGKKQFAKFRMLQIEEDRHVYVIYIFVTLLFRTEVILVSRYITLALADTVIIILVTHSTLVT